MAKPIYEFAELPKAVARPKAPAGQARRSQSRRLSSRRARIGIIYNPRSHRNRGQDLALGDRHHVMVATPEKREQIVAALRDFATSDIDYLIINGGDGTARRADAGPGGRRRLAGAGSAARRTNALNVIRAVEVVAA